MLFVVLQDMKTKNLFFFVLILVLCVFGLKKYWRTNSHLEAIYFDWTHDNPSIDSPAALQEMLDQFERKSLADLPDSYLQKTKMKEAKYSEMLGAMHFYEIKKKDCYRKIVGDFRIKDFIAKDQFFRNRTYTSSTPLYWGIQPEILHKLMELKIILEKRKLNWKGIKINSGHRTPHHNEAVKGASKSRHIVGEALDLKIGDVDNSGFYTEADKAIILEICEKELIKDKGGIGLYPGTRVVHIDTRGYRARWNDY